MDFRETTGFLDRSKALRRISKPLDPALEAARALRDVLPSPVLLEGVRGGRVVSGAVSRAAAAEALGVPEPELAAQIAEAAEAAPPPFRPAEPAFREVKGRKVSFRSLPVLTYFRSDGGPYLTGSVFVVNDPELGPNASFHRMMVLDAKRAAVRVVEGRGLHQALGKTGGKAPCAVCIGAPIAFQLAAACPLPDGRDELAMANALTPTPVAEVEGLRVPASCEIVLFGRFTGETAEEGPFVDITGANDIVREQPVFRVERLFLRDGFLYHAILPGGAEHRFLMGFPREAAILGAVGEVCRVRSVRLTDGGSGWLHAAIAIEKTDDGEPREAGEAAFRAHPSLKHVVVVDEDIDPGSPVDVEWAIATRFQADQDLTVLPDRTGSSLDPSARHEPGKKSRTAKMIVDATRKKGGPFARVRE
jgi:2,5-furandicarboxylate decarboxylase 1